MIRPAIVFNELSLPGLSQQMETVKTLDNFAATLTAVRMNRADAYLVSSVQLWGSGANLHSIFGPLAGAPENKDKLRQIAAMQNRAPLESEFGVLGSDESLIEYTFGGSICHGLGYAHQFDLLAISIRTSEELDATWLDLYRSSLANTDEEVCSDLVSVRHASTPTHVSSHLDWFSQQDLLSMSADRLWSQRGALFDRIEFLDRVEGDLRRLDGRSLESVKGRLGELQSALAAWDTESDVEPQWLSKITPESESRIQSGVCNFRDTDGRVRAFSPHARYTPGAGRIHFRLRRAIGRIVVAYVGAKLGS